MKNHKLLLLISILSTMVLSGCLGERLISISKNFYSQNNMLCVTHATDIKIGYISFMVDDVVVKLQRVAPKTSCVPFKIKDNQISVKTTDDRTVNIVPYKAYYLHSDIKKNNGEGAKQSGLGPEICFTKEDGGFILHVVNGGDTTNKIEEFGCRV